MNVGLFTKSPSGQFSGNLPTMGFNGVSIETIKKVGNGPDYAVTVDGAELGAAWNQTAGKTGRAYLSINITIPGQAPVRLALFSTETPGQHVAVYSAPERKAKAEQAAPSDDIAF